MKARYSLFLMILVFCGTAIAQNYTTQDMTLQLDENGEATLIPEDVLVNTTGTLWAISGTINEFLQFHYDQEALTLDFIEEVDELCLGLELFYSYDRNPINKQEYMTATLIDCCNIFSPYSNTIDCDTSGALGSINSKENECNFSFDPPTLFSFDKEGILYETNYDSSNAISTFDPYSNIRTFFTDNVFDPIDSGLTYDFENHRLIGTTIYLSNNLSFVEIDIDTAEWDVLFEITPANGCVANAIEYIGNDMMLVGSYSNNCPEIYVINLVTQETTVLASNYSVGEFLFIEDEIPDATLSQSQFSCSDVGEQIVDITVIENGIPVNYQATVNVVPDFSVRNCRVFRSLTTPDPNGSDDAVLGDYTDTIDVVSSCSSTFTITQNPPPGTLVSHEALVTITLTITDELGNTALCQTIGCSDSPLSVDDNPLQNNFVVSPNPTSDHISIENKNNWYVSHIEILDISGRILETKEIKSGDNTMSLSLSPYSSGSYFVRINAEENFLVKQIIKR